MCSGTLLSMHMRSVEVCVHTVWRTQFEAVGSLCGRMRAPAAAAHLLVDVGVNTQFRLLVGEG